MKEVKDGMEPLFKVNSLRNIKLESDVPVPASAKPETAPVNAGKAGKQHQSQNDEKTPAVDIVRHLLLIDRREAASSDGFSSGPTAGF